MATTASIPYATDQEISTPHVARLVVSWVLMIPLLFFAVAGAVRFDSYSRNNALEAGYTSLIPSQTHGFTQITLALVFSICAMLFCTQLQGVAAIARDNLTFVALAVLALLSTVWSQFPGDSLTLAIYVTLNLCFAFYLAARFTPIRQMQVFVTCGWVVILACVSTAILLPNYGIDNQGGDGTVGAWIGIFPHKNWCAVMLAFLLSAAFYMRPASPLSRFGRIVYVTLSFGIILMSKSRTGWIVAGGLLLYVVALRFVKRWRAKDKWLIMSVGGGGAAVTGYLFATYYATIMSLIGKDPTLTGRTKIWNLVLASAMRRPLLGYGYRAFWHGLQGESANVALADRWIVPAAHNGFLDLWLGLGIIGVGLVVYSMFRAVQNGVVCLQRGSSRPAEWFLCLIWLTLISNIAELTLMVPNDLAWIMYVLACVGLSQAAKRCRAPAQFDSFQPFGSMIGGRNETRRPIKHPG